MRTLLDLLERFSGLGDREAVRHYDGYRTHVSSYRGLLKEIASTAALLEAKGIAKGDRLIIWSENRTEWISLFWACLIRGIQVVPLDHRSSPDFVDRIQSEVGARLLAHGQVEVGKTRVPLLPLHQIASLPEAPAPVWSPSNPNDVVEIVFTSGTTGEPKGVVHKHRNIVANLKPFADEIKRYRRYARPFQPIRLLDLLPLSHMFGQSLGIFIPVLLEGAAAFASSLHPGAVIETVRREKVSVLVGVPRMLESLRNEIERRFEVGEPRPHAKGLTGIVQRWWRHRRIHSAFGWKFWALCVGGAEVDDEVNDFFGRLGFLVIQGYGLTETSPVVAVNHPFRNQPGSIGSVLPGQEVRLADDGEILVRGESVVSAYLSGGREQRLSGSDGWLHTGDLGEFDSSGRLYYRGRKKDLIVTAEGLNVYPQDVEAALNQLDGIREAVVVPVKSPKGERVHAAMILEGSEINPSDLISQANASLETHQRIRSWSIWPDSDFPRTESTFKVKRALVARQVGCGPEDVQSTESADPLDSLLARVCGESAKGARPSTRLSEDLGISSLDRMELLSGLEDAYLISLDEERFAALSTLGELRECVAGASRRQAQSPSAEASNRPNGASGVDPPARRRFFWQSGLIHWLRVPLLEAVGLPLCRLAIKLEVEGRENLAGLDPPVLFVANHASHFDAPAVLMALPFGWRRRVSPAMRQEHFMALYQPQRFSWRERLKSRFQYLLAAGLFAAYPLPQRMGGVRSVLQFMGRLVDAGRCPLVFPEGRRTPDGEMMPFQPGAAVMAQRLGLLVVPIHLTGLFEIYSKFQQYPRPGKALARIGPPLDVRGLEDPRNATRRIEDAVRSLCES